MNKYEALRQLEARLMGFAMAVKDLEDCQAPMEHKKIVWTLVNFAVEYNTIRDSINESTK